MSWPHLKKSTSELLASISAVASSHAPWIASWRLSLACVTLLALQCYWPDFCDAQSVSNTRKSYGPSAHRAAVAGAHERRPGAKRVSASLTPGQRRKGTVRTASVEVFEDFPDSPVYDNPVHDNYDQEYFSNEGYVDNAYEQTLAPGSMHYDTGDMAIGQGGCQSCGAGEGACHCQPFGWLLDWSRGDLWVGTVGFAGAGSSLGTSAGDAGQVAGNFGFQEGFNFGTRLPGLLRGQLGSQIGMRFSQSQLDGTSAGDDNRTQTFITAGLFRRVDYGFQGGLVVDYLHDDWVYKADLLQLRGELSFLFSPCHDFGFRFADSQQTDETEAFVRGQAAPIPVQLSGLNNYRFFYRARFGPHAAGSAELEAGFTEESTAILGANIRTPLQNQLGLDVNATYLFPPSNIDMPYTREGWNLSMALVWTPGRCFGSDRDYYRPLFSVGDNGSFLTRHAPP